jgi:regulator of cell morphogenesis and NO signaling
MEADFQIDQIIQRYDLHADKDLLYSYEELQRMDIDLEFIYVLLHAFEDEFSFSENEYQKFSLDIIIDYIRRTHKYYLSKKLYEIEQSIQILLKDYEGNHPLLQILNTFYNEYTTDLKEHIRIEERDLLPYIKCLLEYERGLLDREKYLQARKNYSLQQFIDSHHDTEKDLSDVRQAILNYQPPKTNQTPYRILTTQLQAFEKDLSIHALIEDKVLIPRAMELEQKLSNS